MDLSPELPRDGASPTELPHGADIETLRRGLRLMALKMLGDPEEADEIAQEALARALAALREGRYDERQPLGPFVRGIARHVIADVRRERSGTVALDPEAADPPASSSVDALQSLVTAEDRARVRAALGLLVRGDREILRLVYYEGLRPVDVAARLDEPVTRIRKRKSRALARLRQAMRRIEESRKARIPEYSIDGRGAIVPEEGS